MSRIKVIKHVNPSRKVIIKENIKAFVQIFSSVECTQHNMRISHSLHFEPRSGTTSLEFYEKCEASVKLTDRLDSNECVRARGRDR